MQKTKCNDQPEEAALGSPLEREQHEQEQIVALSKKLKEELCPGALDEKEAQADPYSKAEMKVVMKESTTNTIERDEDKVAPNLNAAIMIF
jgi:hypothetical protein